MTRIHQTTPFLHVPNMEEALNVLCGILPFTIVYREANYSYLEIEGAGLRVLEEKGRVLNPDGKSRVTVYIDVSDVDDLYAELRAKLDRLPGGSVVPPEDQPWKQREFQVRLPDGDWLTFGQPVRPKP